MIAFATAVSDVEAYRRYAEPGIRRVAEPDSTVHALSAVGPITRTNNLLLDEVAREAGDALEALVIVHPHAELLGPAFAERVRAALADPDVAVLGCVGASGVASLAWWRGTLAGAAVEHRYDEYGGGAMPAFDWARPRPAPADVDVVDGHVLVLSPWAVEHLRFDESLVLGHGFEVDLCLQAREAGRRVVVAEIPARLHRSLELVPEPEIWVEAHKHLADKWEGRLLEATPDEAAWRARARRAEAERDAARAIAYTEALQLDARVLGLERELEALSATASWRLTAPLRRLNDRRRAAMARGRG